jgi:hypothetical protein
VANGGRYCPSSRDNPPDRPLRRAVSISNMTPACDTSDAPPAITDNQGCKSLCCTREVPFNSVRVRSRQPGQITAAALVLLLHHEHDRTS